jgi:predicted DNA-binding transcriptional regulator AlpA
MDENHPVAADLAANITGLSTAEAWRLSRSTLHRSVVGRGFPKAVKLSAGRRGWRLRDVLHWLDTR